MVVTIMATYFTLYVLISKYLLKDKIPLFILLFIFSSIVFGFADRVYNKLVLYPLLYPKNADEYKIISFSLAWSMFGIYGVVLLASSIKLIKYWIISKNQQVELKAQVMKSELALMKSQIHPHFLFNTINNIYSLTLKKSDKAPEMLLKLSEILRYMLYECNVPLIELEKELAYIRNYIMLEQIRYGNRIDIKYNANGNTYDKLIAPLILLPFVENCFKHGVSKKRDSIWVHIEIDIVDDQLKVLIKNSKLTNARTDINDYSEGIGLKNVRKRLDILYKENYELVIDNQSDTFIVELNLKLNYIQEGAL